MARKRDESAPMRTFTKSLRVDLRQDEKHRKAIEMAAEQRELELAEAAKDEATKMHNATIKTHESRVSELAPVVNQGWEFRDVEIDEMADWPGKRIVQVRRDTGEMVFERPMTETERQPPLPIEA